MPAQRLQGLVSAHEPEYAAWRCCSADPTPSPPMLKGSWARCALRSGRGISPSPPPVGPRRRAGRRNLQCQPVARSAPSTCIGAWHGTAATTTLIAGEALVAAAIATDPSFDRVVAARGEPRASKDARSERLRRGSAEQGYSLRPALYAIAQHPAAAAVNV